MQKPFSIYSTWGFQDELGDNVELNEELARKALNGLRLWRDKYGIKQDIFALDAFWFDPEKGYRHFKKPHWPNGFEPLVEDILQMDMKPGLWYSTNGLRLHVPEWEESLCADGCNYTLAEGPFAEDLWKSLLYAAEKWHVRLFKFDFANLFADTARSKRSLEETYRLNLAKFKEILADLRIKYPDIYIITHCGFARNHGFSIPASNEIVAADLSLLEAVDAHFSGDPQTWDIPQTAITRNVDLFQDHQVWKMHSEGFPLHRIEDHGIIAGTTNTCFYRGRAGFKRSYLAQLARGGGRDMFYGNPNILNDSDLKYMRRARELFFDAFKRKLTTCFIGGEPGVAPWHGYLTGGGHRGLAYIVNPQKYRQEISLVLPCLYEARILFFDGEESPKLQVQPDQFRISLGPEQMVLVGTGDYANDKFDLGSEPDANLPREIQLLPLRFETTNNGKIIANLSSLPTGTELHIVVEVRDAKSQNICFKPFRFGGQSTHDNSDMTPKTHEIVKISVFKDGKELQPTLRIPDVPVWAGISWVAASYKVDAPLKIEINQNFPEPKRLRTSAYVLKR